MIKQTLMFTTPVSLSLKDQQMVITFKDNKDTVTRPIEDIGFVIIENPMISITVPLQTFGERKKRKKYRQTHYNWNFFSKFAADNPHSNHFLGIK